MIRNDTVTPVPAQELFETMDQLLTEGYDAEFTVTGKSMWPFLRPNRDRVVLRRWDTQKLKSGQIVLYRSGQDHYRLHRIQWVRKGSFQAIGDGNCVKDGQYPTCCVLGVVVGVFREERYIPAQRGVYGLLGALWMLLYPVRPGLLRLLYALAGKRKGDRD